MVRGALTSDTEEVKKLWKMGFNDPEDFIDFYFKERYKTENTLVYRYEGKTAACAQIFPFDMLLFEEIIKSSYILGVVTHPDYRKNGLMRQILHYSFNKQYAEGILSTVLIPQSVQLFDMYRKFGFVELFNIRTAEFTKDEIVNKKTKNKSEDCSVIKIDNKNFNMINYSEFYEFYSDMYKKSDCTLLKSYNDFIFTLKEFTFYGDGIYILHDKKTGRINGCGLLESQRSESTKVISELLYEGESAFSSILSAASEENGIERVVLKTVENAENYGDAECLGMIRVINAYKLLNTMVNNGIKFRNKFAIKITDDIIKDNNRTFVMLDNIFKQSYSSKADINIDISRLLPEIFTFSNKKNLCCYINSMLN